MAKALAFSLRKKGQNCQCQIVKLSFSKYGLKWGKNPENGFPVGTCPNRSLTSWAVTQPRGDLNMTEPGERQCKREAGAERLRLELVSLSLAQKSREVTGAVSGIRHRKMCNSLAVFDFDRTLVDEDSDAAIIDLLSTAEPPPDWESGTIDWTPYMDEVLGLVHAAGFSKEDVLARIGRMRPVAGAVQLIALLADAGWHVLLLTDSNSVFVHHWLKVHELEDKITYVLTNPARWSAEGRLHVQPHTHQEACARCPTNLCKALALATWRERRAPYSRVLYAGDGRNDYCPMASLGTNDLVCPRVGYPCEKAIQMCPPRATVLPWRDHYDIMRHLYPETPTRIDTQ